MSPLSLLAQLRAATASLHEAVEAGLDIEARLHDPRSRPQMVAAFCAFHQSVEAALRPHAAALELAGWPVASRAPQIGREAAALGVRVPAPSVPPNIGSLAEALGWIYVAEGSTLGGRIIRRRISVSGVSLAGLDFLDPWGEATGLRWRTFIAVLETAEVSGQIRAADVVKGACAAFAFARDALAPFYNSEPA